MKAYYIVILFILPLILMASGAAWRKDGPKKINKAFGYRTARSMKNQETWQFAHRCVGRLWYGSGIGMMLLSLILLVFFGRGAVELLMNAATAAIFGQLAVMLLTIWATERELKRNFDEQGRRITQTKE